MDCAWTLTLYVPIKREIKERCLKYVRGLPSWVSNEKKMLICRKRAEEEKVLLIKMLQVGGEVRNHLERRKVTWCLWMSWMTKNGHSSEWLFSLGHSSRCVSTIFLLLLCHLFGCWAGLNCRKAPEIFFITSNRPRKCVYSTLYSIVTYKVKVSLMGLMYQIFVFYSLFICFQWKINYFSQDSTWDQAKWYILNDGVILQSRFFFFFFTIKK